MNRRAAIATLLTASPAMLTASDIKWAASSALAATPLLTISPDGTIGVNLDSLRCLRVTLGGESIDVSAAEIFEALKAPAPHVHSWHAGPFYVTVAASYEEPTFYSPSAVLGVETCDCGLMRLPDGLGREAGPNLARREP